MYVRVRLLLVGITIHGIFGLSGKEGGEVEMEGRARMVAGLGKRQWRRTVGVMSDLPTVCLLLLYFLFLFYLVGRGGETGDIVKRWENTDFMALDALLVVTFLA